MIPARLAVSAMLLTALLNGGITSRAGARPARHPACNLHPFGERPTRILRRAARVLVFQAATDAFACWRPTGRVRALAETARLPLEFKLRGQWLAYATDGGVLDGDDFSVVDVRAGRRWGGHLGDADNGARFLIDASGRAAWTDVETPSPDAGRSGQPSTVAVLVHDRGGTRRVGRGTSTDIPPASLSLRAGIAGWSRDGVRYHLPLRAT